MLDSRSTLAALFAAPVLPGRIEWIGVRPERRAPLQALAEVRVEPGEGVIGDHYRSRSSGKRQVTLIAAEHLAAIAAYLGREQVEPELLRRNLVTRGVNLLALKDKRFRVGEALLEYTGECHPCSLMERLLGVGGYNAVRGHGGITARVLQGGRLALGDALVVADALPAPTG